MTHDTFPAWLESDTPHGTGGMWPLGLEPLGFRLIGRLTPALTNATNRIRYYSFFSWVFWTFKEAADQRIVLRTRAAQTAWRERLEMIFRLATLHADPDVVGLVGSTQISPADQTPDEKITLLREGVTTAFKAASYSSSFENFGCGRTLATGLVQLSDEIGVPLARAFDARLRMEAKAEEIEWILSSEPEIPAGVLYRLADVIGLRSVEPWEPEHPVLLDMLLRMRGLEDQALGPLDDLRSRSLALLLEIVRQTPDGLPDARALHAVFATGQLPGGSDLQVPDGLREHFRRWQRYQERQFQKIALYGFWSALIELLHRGISRPDRLAERLKAAVSGSKMAGDWLGSDPLALTCGAAQERIFARAVDAGDPWGVTQVALVGSVFDWKAQWEERAGSALCLLLLTTRAWAEIRDQAPPSERRLHDGEPERLCLNDVTRALEARAGQPLGEVLRWVFSAWVLAQANRTALAKLIQQRQYQFFVAQDEAGYRMVKPIAASDYVKYDDPHGDQAYDLLAGLYLVERNATIRITPDGAAALERLLKYHGRRAEERHARVA